MEEILLQILEELKAIRSRLDNFSGVMGAGNGDISKQIPSLIASMPHEYRSMFEGFLNTFQGMVKP